MLRKNSAGSLLQSCRGYSSGPRCEAAPSSTQSSSTYVIPGRPGNLARRSGSAERRGNEGRGEMFHFDSGADSDSSDRRKSRRPYGSPRCRSCTSPRKSVPRVSAAFTFQMSVTRRARASQRSGYGTRRAPTYSAQDVPAVAGFLGKVTNFSTSSRRRGVLIAVT